MLDVRLNPPLTDALTDRLEAIWLAVTRAGGAVGFPPDASAGDVAAGAAGHWDAVLDGDLDLLVAVDDGEPVGFAFLRLGSSPVERHRGEVLRLQRDPAHRGRAIGTALLDALEERAAERGVELLTLEVRTGTGREGLYADRGFRTVATLPGWVLVAGRPAGLIVMAKALDGRPLDGQPPDGGPSDDRPPTPRSPVQLLVTRLDPDLPLPRYARPGDAGLDLHARERKVLPAGVRALMPTGVAVAIPEGYVGLVHPRSGLAVRHGLSIVNAPGTIDAGYRGEVIVPLINLDPSATIRIERGDRIAQLLVQPVERVELVEVDDLPEGIRGTGGFGSTGR